MSESSSTLAVAYFLRWGGAVFLKWARGNDVVLWMLFLLANQQAAIPITDTCMSLHTHVHYKHIKKNINRTCNMYNITSATNPLFLCTPQLNCNMKISPKHQHDKHPTHSHAQGRGLVVGCRSNEVSLSHGVSLPGRVESGGLQWGSAAPALYCLAGAQSEGGNL